MRNAGMRNIEVKNMEQNYLGRVIAAVVATRIETEEAVAEIGELPIRSE